jgi:phosphate uptake regulator
MDIPRKIQVTGRNTFIVSLPHGWASKNSIEKGDPVYLEENDDGSLHLALEKSSRDLKTCTIDVSSDSSEISMRNIVSAYVGGAGKIILRGKGTYTLAEEARRILSGVEISEEDDEALVLRILAFDDLQMDNIIKREFSVTRSMFELAGSFFKQGSDVLTELSRKEDEVDRLYILLLRNLCIGSNPGKEAVFKAIAAKSIEKVSDHLEDICIYGKDIAPSPPMGMLLERSFGIYLTAYKSFSENSLDHEGFTEAKGAYLAECEKVEAALKKEKNQSRMLGLRSLSERCSKVVRYSEDIMESANDILFARMGGFEAGKNKF